MDGIPTTILLIIGIGTTLLGVAWILLLIGVEAFRQVYVKLLQAVKEVEKTKAEK